ncbi:MAG: extensin family protein [Sphingomonas sp.]
MRIVAACLPLVLLAGCFGGGNDRPPPPRQDAGRPLGYRAPPSAQTRACLADLSRSGIRYSPVPDQNFGGGCAIAGAVSLLDIGVPVTGLRAMRCGLAEAFTGWVRYAVAPAAYQILGSNLVRVETFGTYACRNVIGNAAAGNRRSGHAIANAVDVAAFVLADGRRVTVASDWRSGSPETQAFWRTIHASACKRFGTVLSPDYNTAHRDHLHLEDDAASFCR